MAKRPTKKMSLPINEALGTILGAVAAKYVTETANKMLPKLPSSVKSALPLAVGIFLAGNKNTLVKGAGLGMIAKGGSDLASSFLSPMPDTPEVKTGVVGLDTDMLFMNGAEDFLSSPADQSILSSPADQSILSEPFEDSLEEAMLSAFDSEDFA